jgi:hypothetical protein
MSELSDFLKLIAEGKKTDPVAVKAKEQREYIQEVVKEDLGSLFSQLATLKNKQKEVQVQAPIVEEVLIERIYTEPPTEPIPAAQVHSTSEIDKYLTTKSFQQPNPDKVSPELKALTEKVKFLEQAIGRIAATGPGSGEVNLRWLDDVKRDTISDGRWLKYDDSLKKFVFDEINPYEVVYNTTHVTTPTYTVQDNDFYIGVDYAGPVTINLPVSANSGRMLIIKDEDGDAETNPITVLGTVDNDAGGFIIQIDNGAIQLLYRNGWRIV